MDRTVRDAHYVPHGAHYITIRIGQCSGAAAYRAKYNVIELTGASKTRLLLRKGLYPHWSAFTAYSKELFDINFFSNFTEYSSNGNVVSILSRTSSSREFQASKIVVF